MADDKPTEPEDQWDLDPFEDDASRQASDQQVIAMKEFVEKHATQLIEIEEMLDETLTDAWDFHSDLISLSIQPYEQTTVVDLIRTDNKLYNKVTMAFAALCDEVSFLREVALKKFYPALVLFGQENTADSTTSPNSSTPTTSTEVKENGTDATSTTVTNGEGDIQIQLGKMLPFLQEMSNFVHRCYELTKNFVRQLASLYHPQQKLYQTSYKNVHLKTVFDHLSELFLLLITFDEIITQNSALPVSWGAYKRMLKVIKKEPAKYGVVEEQLFQFEKMMLKLKDFVLEGLIFQNCIEQEFDVPNFYEVRSNGIFKKEFFDYLQSSLRAFVSKDVLLEETLKKKYIMLCSSFALYNCLYPEKSNGKFARQLWELQKDYPLVHLYGPVVWNSGNFMLKTFPVVLKAIKAPDMKQVKVQVLAEFDKELPLKVKLFSLRVSKWMVQMVSNVPLKIRMALFLRGLILAHQVGSLFKMALFLHTDLNIPLKMSLIGYLFQCIELLKAINGIFHSQSTLIGNHLSRIMRSLAYAVGTKIDKVKALLDGRSAAKSGDKARLTTKLSPLVLDQLAAMTLALQMLNGPGTLQRFTILRIAMHHLIYGPYQNESDYFDSETIQSIWRHLIRLETLSKLQKSLQEATDCSFLYFHREFLPAYLEYIYNNPEQAHRLTYLWAALRDIIPVFYKSVHVRPQVFLENFKKEIEDVLQTRIVKKLCADIENDLRLQTGMTTKENPLKSGIKDVSKFLNLRPLRFYTMNFDIRAFVAHYLDTVFYNLNTVALYDWHFYGQMRNLAKEKYNLDLIEPHLPGQTLEQGLDVLEIMRNIHIFVSRYNYNLNNQIFIERTSDNKTLNTINIQHIANSIRTHGTGIMNTTVNFTYQFLKQKFKTFSQFLFDDIIKSRLGRDVRFYNENREKLDNRYPYERAEKFLRDIKKLGTTEDKMSYIDKFRVLITEIGNAMGYIRMIRSGGLLYTSNSIKFVPDLQNIPKFEEFVTKERLSPETIESAKNLDSVLQTMSRNFAEGTEYFKMLVSVFQKGFQSADMSHLKNFYVIVPPLTINYVEYMLIAKEKFGKKGKWDGIFTDDGFAIGVAYILKLLDQYKGFDSLNWFDSVMAKFAQQEKDVKSKTGAQDVKTAQLTIKKLKGFQQEFELLRYIFSGARVFFHYEQ